MFRIETALERGIRTFTVLLEMPPGSRVPDVKILKQVLRSHLVELRERIDRVLLTYKEV